MVAAAVPGQPQRHRIAVYFVGPKWRAFDVDLSRGSWTGFGTDASYK